MENIHSTAYSEILFNKEEALMEISWLPSSQDMNEEEFKEIIILWKNSIINNSAQLSLLDSTDFGFCVSPEVQDWMATEIVKLCVEAGLKKMATILPKEEYFVAQISVEQAMNENKDQGGLPSQYFTNKEEAIEWLLSVPYSISLE